MGDVKEPSKKKRDRLLSIIPDLLSQTGALIPVSEEKQKIYTQAPTQVTVIDTLSHSFVLNDLGLYYAALLLPGASVHHLLLMLGLKK